MKKLKGKERKRSMTVKNYVVILFKSMAVIILNDKNLLNLGYLY